ncbi:MAG: AcrR family transcriptional regulator [Kiritimatiellia bacterium]|jgi:AcrR family transcriptional regulator
MIRDARRAEIIVSARRLVAKGGLGALTISALEQRLPFSRGVITHHFKNKREIVLAVLTSAVSDIDAPVAPGALAHLSWPERVHTVLRTKVEGFLKNPEASWILIAFWGQVRSDPEAARRAGDLFERYRLESSALMVSGQYEGVVHDNIEHEPLAIVLVGTVIGMVVQHLLSEGTIDTTSGVHAATQGIIAYCAQDPKLTT